LNWFFFYYFDITEKDSFRKTSGIFRIEARALHSSTYTPSTRTISITGVLVTVLSFTFIRSFT
jgi:hypothetical protein